MRHLALLALLALSSLACTQAVGEEDELVGADENEVDREGESVAGTKVVGSQLTATDNVNLRAGPSTGYKILKVIPAGAAVTVVAGSPSGSFYNINYAGITGWSHGAYFNAVSSSTPPPTSSTPPPTSGGSDCQASLRALGLTVKDSGPVKGIADPVTVSSPIRGVAFRYVASSTTAPILGNCQFFVKLAAAADKMKAWGVAEFTHIGTYNYRTIAGSSKLSQHALGMAIDIAGFKTTEGVYYSIANNSHFVKNTSSATCTQARNTAGDKLLKGWACDVAASNVFNIILTPNYSDSHRDHFHVDLTAGSDFIKGPGEATYEPVASGIDPIGAVADDDDVHEAIPNELLRRELRIQEDLGAVLAQ